MHYWPRNQAFFCLIWKASSGERWATNRSFRYIVKPLSGLYSWSLHFKTRTSRSSAMGSKVDHLKYFSWDLIKKIPYFNSYFTSLWHSVNKFSVLLINVTLFLDKLIQLGVFYDTGVFHWHAFVTHQTLCLHFVLKC